MEKTSHVAAASNTVQALWRFMCLTYTPAITQESFTSDLYETGGFLWLLLVTSVPGDPSPGKTKWTL